jgi:hypothetical protein
MELRKERPAVRPAARPAAPKMAHAIDLVTLSSDLRSVRRVERRLLRQTARPRAFRGWMPSLHHVR